MPAPIEPDDHLDLLRADVARVMACRGADVSAMVPSIPGWTLHELLGHVSGVFRFATTQLRADPGADLQKLDAFDDADERLDPFDLFEQESTALLAELIAVDPDEHRPNWIDADDSRFWFRRMSHELAVHRWDVQSAAGGAPDPVPTRQAVDGIEELCDVFLVHAGARGITGTGETVHLHCTDVDAGGEWTFTFHADGVDVERAHTKGDMAGRGTASDLLLFCWNRGPVDVATFGEPDLAGWWPRRVRI